DGIRDSSVTGVQTCALPISILYVGNPLLDELPLETTREQARNALGLGAGDRVVTLMAGSRPSELKRHFEPMLDATLLAAQRLREIGRASCRGGVGRWGVAGV